MAANFPTNLPGLNSGQPWVDGTTIIEASLLNQIQLEIDAIAAKVGKTSSAVSSSHDYILSHTGIAQQVVSEDATIDTGTTVMPKDDTIPQNTEGHEFLTRSITPTRAANILVIEVQAWLGNSVDAVIGGAIFQDSTANALAAGSTFPHVSYSTPSLLYIRHRMTAGTTSSTTFKFRAGQDVAHSLVMNGYWNGSAGVRRYGGVLTSRMTVTEYRV